MHHQVPVEQHAPPIRIVIKVLAAVVVPIQWWYRPMQELQVAAVAKEKEHLVILLVPH